MLKCTLHTFSILLCIIIFIGCTGNNDIKTGNNLENPRTLKIPVSELTDQVTFNEMFTNNEYIKLELTEKSLIGQISKIVITDEYIFILDWIKSRQLFQFSRNGKFLRIFGEHGKGPTEYLLPYDFFIDTISKTINLLDDGEKIHTYSYIDGNYIETINIPNDIPANSIGFLPPKNYAIICGRFEPELLLCDKDFNKRKYYFPFENRNYRVLQIGTFKKTARNTLYFTRRSIDTIYEVTKQGLNPYKTLDFGNDVNVHHKLVNEKSDPKFDELEKAKFNIGCYTEDKDENYFLLAHKNGEFFYTFSTKNEKTICCKKQDFINDVFGQKTLLNSGITDNMEKFIFYAEPSDIIRIKKEFPERFKDVKFNSFIEDFQDEDNPIIVLSELR